MDGASQRAHLVGIFYYSVGVFLFALNDALGKWLVADYSVGQIMLLRTVGAGFLLVPLLFIHRPRLFDTDQIGLKLMRVACMAADSFAFYYSTRYLPLADVMTFYMAAPLIITALSVPFLGEKVGVFRWAAVLVGFVGVLIALRPTEAAFSAAALIALFGASMYAGGVAITRKLRDSHWLQLVTWQFVGAGLIGAVVSPFSWVPPTAGDVSLMFVLGLVAMSCFIMITQALASTPASVLAPFQYTSIVWAVLLGVMIWGDVPTWGIVVGNVVIVASGLVIFYREHRRGRHVADGVEPIP